MLSYHLILCCPLLLLSSIFPSIRVFSNELALCIRWPKYWSFSIISSNEYSGLVSFRIDWFYLLAVHKTLKSLLQHHIKKNIYFDWMIITLQYCDVFCYTSKWMNQGYCSSIMIWKHQLLFGTQPSIWFSSHICTWLLGKIALTRWNFVGKVISLLSNTLSSFVVAFLSRVNVF